MGCNQHRGIKGFVSSLAQIVRERKIDSCVYRFGCKAQPSEELYMEKHEHVFERFIDFENLYGGYLLARKNKRYKNDVLEYTANLEENLINAQNHLIWKTYSVDGLREFIEYYPKKRIITVMPFKNRVVNCAAHNVLWPIYTKSFYEHSYGSIEGRGSIKAAKQLQYWMQLIRHSGEKWWLLKLDVKKFFFRVPYEVQLEYLGKPLNDPDMMWFLEKAIRCDGRAFGLPLDASDVTDCERISGIGMQVGSLISQMTGNVVLTPLDHYIKRELRVPYYIRNMDDMIALVPSKEQAHEVHGRVEDFLYERLGLNLNSKTAVMPYDEGVEFVGRRIWPHKLQLRKSTSLHMKQHLRYVMDHYSTGEISLDYALDVITSYLGLMKHCDCDALRNKVLDDFVLVRHYAEENSISRPDI